MLAATDPDTADGLAGGAAVAAGACWLAWAVGNTLSHGALEHSPRGSALLVAGSLLTAGWNLLMVPAALRLHLRLRWPSARLLPLLTGAGIASLLLWAAGGLTRVTHTLEFGYLALATIWLLGIAPLLRRRHPRLAVFTLVVGAFTALDALFNRFEPMPFALYVLAAPKLPLAAAWNLAVGITLLRRREPAGG